MTDFILRILVGNPWRSALLGALLLWASWRVVGGWTVALVVLGAAWELVRWPGLRWP